MLKAEKVLEPNPVFKVLLTIVDLHYGTFGGLATRILYVFIGLMPTVLFITGLVMRRRQGWLKARQKADDLLAKQTPKNTD